MSKWASAKNSALHENWSFPLKISWVNVVAFSEEILDGKLHFFCNGGCSEKGKGKLVAMEYFCYFASSEAVLKRFLQTVVVIEYFFKKKL